MTEKTGEAERNWLIYGAVTRTQTGPDPELLKRMGEPPTWRQVPVAPRVTAQPASPQSAAVSANGQSAGDEAPQSSSGGGTAHLPPKGQPAREASSESSKGRTYEAGLDEHKKVTAALILRRPLLVTGDPGTGKTSLAYAVAHELGLGPVLHWAVSSRTRVQDGLYQYDAIGRLQDQDQGPNPDRRRGPRATIHRYLQLGPLGTAFFGRNNPDDPSRPYPRVLLIDEVDKGDVDLPNDLLHLFEEQYFDIPELARIADEEESVSPGGVVLPKPKDKPFAIRPSDSAHPAAASWRKGRTVEVPSDGRVWCAVFPVIIMTSNGEREFPPAFLRRCLVLHIGKPDDTKLVKIVRNHFSDTELSDLHEASKTEIAKLVTDFIEARKQASGALGSDQLLNACEMLLRTRAPDAPVADMRIKEFEQILWHP